MKDTRSRAATRRDDGPAGRPIVVLPVIEEDARVGKRVVETGRVRVRTLVRQRIARLDTELRRDDVVVERVPIDRLVTEAPATRREGDVLVIPVVEEVLVKGLRLIEEIRIRRRRQVARRVTRVPLRRQDVVVERRR